MSFLCIPDKEKCQWPNSTKFCCSGLCHVLAPETVGFCAPSSRPSGSNSSNSDPDSTSSPSTTINLQSYVGIIGLIFLGLLLLSALIALFLLCRRLMKKKKSKYLELGEFAALTRVEIKTFLEGNPEMIQINNKNAHEMVDDMPYDRRYEIPEKAFTIDEKEILGSGAFGLVIKGKLWKQEVAIKTINPNSEKSYMKALLTELKVLIYIGEHENVVALLGAYTSHLKSGTLYLFLELCALGNLLNYLRSNRKYFSPGLPKSLFKANDYENTQVDQNPLTEKDLIRWSAQIANGMRFLSDKKVIHGDISARNILLVTREQVKITDFGLSRRLYEYTNYVKKKQEPLPWRWMSIEALRDMNFSTPSDIWSFGVTLWEIYSLGDVPYPGLNWSQDFTYKLVDGLRLLKPIHAQETMYELMMQCWSIEPSSRPTFSSLYSTLMEMNQKCPEI